MIQKAETIKLKVRPVLLGIWHRYFYEGPCRFGKGEALEVGYDKLATEQAFKVFMDNVQNACPEGVELMEPVRVWRTDEWENTEEMWDALKDACTGADVCFLRTTIGIDDLDVEFAERFDVPMIINPESNFSPSSIHAAVKAKNIDREIYVPQDWTHVTKLFKALRAKKVINSTRILLATRFNSDVSYSSCDTFSNHDLVTKNLGVHFRYVNVHELLDQMSPAVEGGNPTTPGRLTPDLTDEDMKEVEALADEIIGHAESVDCERKYLINSLIAYVTVKKNLELKDCNAFTVPCPDVCSTRRLNEMQFTFCLTHSLNMENGIPSACEYDADAALSQQALIAVSGKRPYMGNTTPIPYENGKLFPLFGLTPEIQDKLIKENPHNLYFMQHSVPNRHFVDNEKQGKYALKHFAYEQGFGAVLRYDFEQDKGQVITICRFSPDGSKLVIGRGEIVTSAGYDLNNCNGMVIFRVKDAEDMWEKQIFAGNHMALVYGDYVEELKDLAKVLKIEALVSC
ncbi:MAG: fucose isomerase [Lachnospiraceae bacterium]|nr:fucose isomerase [Lachnospiraceae bacterium]